VPADDFNADVVVGFLRNDGIDALVEELLRGISAGVYTSSRKPCLSRRRSTSRQRWEHLSANSG